MPLAILSRLLAPRDAINSVFYPTHTHTHTTHQEVVTDAASDLAQGVGVQGGDEQQVSPAPELNVQHGVRTLLPHLQYRRV